MIHFLDFLQLYYVFASLGSLGPYKLQPATNGPIIVAGLYLDRGGVDGHFCLGFHACLEQGQVLFFLQKKR